MCVAGVFWHNGSIGLVTIFGCFESITPSGFFKQRELGKETCPPSHQRLLAFVHQILLAIWGICSSKLELLHVCRRWKMDALSKSWHPVLFLLALSMWVGSLTVCSIHSLYTILASHGICAIGSSQPQQLSKLKVYIFSSSLNRRIPEHLVFLVTRFMDGVET